MIVIVYAIYTVFAVLIALDFKPFPGPANIDESIFDLSVRDGIDDAPQTFLAAALFYTSTIPLFLSILLYIGVLAKFILGVSRTFALS
uniref:Uncharacterized protein n=1 Tax=Acrobeloides nanus TaxID=290746 RepID=A0A914CG16_9BILA